MESGPEDVGRSECEELSDKAVKCFAKSCGFVCTRAAEETLLLWSAPPPPALTLAAIHRCSTPSPSEASPVMSPILSPTPPSSMSVSASPIITKSLSASSVQSLAELLTNSSASSLRSEPEIVGVEGLRHVKVHLEARQYKSQFFASQLLDCIQKLQVPAWSNTGFSAQDIKIKKVSGSLTNAVFFVSCLSDQGAPTLLLRIYGPSSSSLISRPRELKTLHVLSSKYHIGSRLYGTFDNGRIEEYFESVTLTPSDVRDPSISRWIGARMAELHSVDMNVIEGPSSSVANGKTKRATVQKSVISWMGPAEAVLALPGIPPDLRKKLDLSAFKEDWSRYLKWLSTVDDVHGGSQRVFAHNDAQYANLLRLKHAKHGDHRQIIVVDFEYAALNPASYDIANHFHEWTSDYDSATPHLLDFSRYPTLEERQNFYRAYLDHISIFDRHWPVDEVERGVLLGRLDEQVRAWSPASHAMWALWGMVQAREDVERNIDQPEFDYLGYALCRMSAFRRDLEILNI